MSSKPVSNDKLSDTRPQDDVKAWYLLLLLSLAFILSMLDRTVLSLLVEPIKAEFDLSDTQIALLQGASFAFFYAIAGLPLGWLADRSNRRNLIASGVGAWSLMTIGCSIASSYAMLFGARVGVAVGEAALSPAAYSMLSDRFSKRRLGRAIGIFTAAGVMGTGLALLIGGALLGYFTKSNGLHLEGIGHFKPWQATFMAVGAPGLALAVIIFVTVREPKRLLTQSTVEGVKPSILAYLKANTGLMVPLLLGYGVIAMLGYSFLSWGPTSMGRVFDLKPQDVGPKFGLIMLVFGSLGPILGGFLSDFLASKGSRTASFDCMVGAATLGLMFSVSAFFARDLNTTLCIYAGIALAFTAILGAVPTTIQIVTPNEYRARVSAIALICANIIGLGFGPLFVGLLNDYVFKATDGIALSLPIVMAGSALASLPLLIMARASFKKAS